MTTIRKAEPADTEGLAGLRATWAREQADSPNDDPDFAETFGRWQTNNPRTTFVATGEDSLVGMVNLLVFERMPKPNTPPSFWIYLCNLYVVPERRGRGLGSALLDAVFEFSNKLGAVRIVLSPSELSRPLYQRNGFSVTDQLLVKSLNPAATGS